ncbi:MarR family winged helix-turn-helix transcriptional regulator [Undibacterium sp. TJN25]|uniref:MarR family winged helix-turn-helix transcriptional regulator n=1 Tax=Undibacterium sp. TJN25 TaxID=3413056 RepID=UPI003BF0F738
MNETANTPMEEGVIKEVTLNCLATRTRRISRVVTGIYDEELRPFGINSSQFTLLVVISRLGPVSRSEIGRNNHQERSTLTRNLQPILAEGWAEEIPHAASGRSRPIAVTPAGRLLLNNAAPAWRAAQARAKKMFGDIGAAAIMDIANELPQQTL